MRGICMVAMAMVAWAGAATRTAWAVSEEPAASVPSFSGARAFELLEAQVAFGPRVPGSEAHEAALDWMLALLKTKAGRVVPHTFVLPDSRGEGSLRLTNVRASFRPELEPRVAFAAHWDSRPEADREPGGAVTEPIPGANDGASGVAVLLALAEILAAHPPAVGVDLLFFDGEDYGREGDPGSYLLGSRRFVTDFPEYRPQALVLLDMVGDRDLRIPMERNSLERSSDLVHRVFARAVAEGLPAFDPSVGVAVFDDHVPFLLAGIPAVDLIDFDYPYWHTREDLPEHCSAESLQQVGSLLVALIYTDFAP
jgi:glutaminyl-peptide cyclotransferase